MCEPTTLMAASIGIGAMSSFGQYKMMSNQAKAQKKINEYNTEAAADAANASHAQLGYRRNQEREAASSKIQQNALAGAKARSTAAVAAGESGVSGNSLDALMQDFYRQEAQYNSSVRENLARQEAGIDFEHEAVKQGQIGRVLSNPMVQKPSAALAVMDFAGNSANALTNYKIATRGTG